MIIIIFGSCVTRDIFRGDFYNGKDNITIDKYFARTSLISLNSKPLNMDVSQKEQLNPFQRRLLSDDLNKSFLSYLNKKKANSFLMIDFLDERFHIVKWNVHYFTRSNEFIKANIYDNCPGIILKRFTNETTELWKENCLLFIQHLRSHFIPDQIILHRAFWKEEYIDKGKVIRFDNQDEIARQNNMLTEYYDFFQNNFPEIRVLDVNHHNLRADKDHVWGLGQMHYQQEYYDACYQFILSLNHQ